MEKVCNRCKKGKPRSEFRVRHKYHNGKRYPYLSSVCRKCDGEISNKNYFEKKSDPVYMDRWRRKSNEYYWHHRILCAQRAKAYRAKPVSQSNRKKYNKKNHERIAAMHKVRARIWLVRNRDALSDVYCLGLIRTQTGLRRDQITLEMIEQKRLSIKIKRKIYEIRKQQTDPPRSNAGVNTVFSGAHLHRGLTPEHADHH